MDKDCIRVPYNGANCILVDGECWKLVSIEQGYVDTISVDNEYDDCSDCIKDATDPEDCFPVIPPYPVDSLYPETSCPPYIPPSSSEVPTFSEHLSSLSSLSDVQMSSSSLSVNGAASEISESSSIDSASSSSSGIKIVL